MAQRHKSGRAGLLLRNDGQQQMRRPFRIVIDLVQRGPAAHDVVGDIFGIGGPGHPGRHVRARDLDANAMVAPEQICSCENFYRIFVDLPGHDFLLSSPRQRMPWAPWL